MPTAKDLITSNNVTKTYQEGRYVCFVLNNGIIVKLNPNEAKERGKAISKKKHRRVKR
jgi:hypothetical protein